MWRTFENNRDYACLLSVPMRSEFKSESGSETINHDKYRAKDAQVCSRCHIFGINVASPHVNFQKFTFIGINYCVEAYEIYRLPRVGTPWQSCHTPNK